MTPAPATRPHAEFSPSGLKSLEICPSFRNRKGTNVKADRGERLHGHVERKDTATLTDPEELRQVQSCLDYYGKLIAKLKDASTVDEVLLPIGEGIFLNGNPDGHPIGYVGSDGVPQGYATFGYPDRLVIHDDGIEILDWKFGEWETPDAKDNLQGMAYAVGVFETYIGCEKVTVHFVQPPINKATVVEFDRSEYPLLKDRILRIIAAAKLDSSSKRVFNTETCRFCARIATCSAPRDAIVKLAETYQASIRVDPSKWPTVHSSQVKDSKVAEEMLDVASIATEWASSVKKHVLDSVLNANITLQNYAVSERKGRTEVSNNESVIALLKDPKAGLGLSDALIARCVDINIPILMSEVTNAHGAQMQASVASVLARSGFLIEGEPTTFLRRKTKSKAKP